MKRTGEVMKDEIIQRILEYKQTYKKAIIEIIMYIMRVWFFERNMCSLQIILQYILSEVKTSSKKVSRRMNMAFFR